MEGTWSHGIPKGVVLAVQRLKIQDPQAKNEGCKGLLGRGVLCRTSSMIDITLCSSQIVGSFGRKQCQDSVVMWAV